MRRAGLLAAAAVLLLAGCGDDPGVDTAAVEALVVETQTAAYPGLDVGPATCPDADEPREGMRLDCRLTVAGAEVPYVVTLRDVESEDVAASVELDAVVVLASEVEALVRQQMSEDFTSIEVVCAHDVLVTAVGETVDCRLAAGAAEKPLSVTVEDEEGHVSLA